MTIGNMKAVKTVETVTLYPLSSLPDLPSQTAQDLTPVELLTDTLAKAPAGMARPRPMTTASGIAHLCILKRSMFEITLGKTSDMSATKIDEGLLYCVDDNNMLRITYSNVSLTGFHI